MSFIPHDELPCPVREIENLFITLADGTRLAARLWLPTDAQAVPVPAILEYIPYRKRDFMRLRDEPMHYYYAAHGYAALRVDLRGSGDSDGILEDEYLPREQQDAVEVIAWIAAQHWCNGNVGMTGISWGGFNSLQVAAHRPPALRAVISLCASDDRYSDDAHYMGGCLLNENQIWGTVLFAGNALPPDPEVVGERWRELWLQRLQANRPFPAHWLRHQRRDAYWQQGSACEDFSRIDCAVYAIGGWADGYSNAVPRLLEGLQAPRKGLIGPWSHSFPHDSIPGPSIGYLQEALRWWDYWLKGIDNGIMREPMLRVWMQDYAAPEPQLESHPGRWVAEQTWPNAATRPAHWYPDGNGGLQDSARAPATFGISSPQTTGLASGNWCGFGGEGDAALDQRGDDGRSLCFDSAPLAADIEILGSPLIRVRLRSDRAQAMLAVRINDVAPGGSSVRVTYGILNLSHRHSHEHPEPLIPHQTTDVVIELNAIAHRFEAGHSIRLALSNAYWPMVWPMPEPVILELDTAGCHLTLPVREPAALDDSLAAFAAPESAQPTSTHTVISPASFKRTIERDLVSNEVIYSLLSEGGDLGSGAVVGIEEIGLELAHSVQRRFRIDDQDPLSASSEIIEDIRLARPGWDIRVRASTLLRANREFFLLDARLSVSENDGPVFEREWQEHIPRDLV